MLPSNPSSSIAAQDVCNPPAPAGPIPTPFPNFAVINSCIPPTMNAVVVRVDNVLHFGPGAATFTAGNLLTNGPLSNGDDAGAAIGVVSNMIIGTANNVLGSLKTFNGMTPSTSLTSQNSTMPNMAGLSVVPANAKVNVLA